MHLKVTEALKKNNSKIMFLSVIISSSLTASNSPSFAVYQDGLSGRQPLLPAKWKLVMSRPPMLTLPSWSSKASHIILSRKMLKRIGESLHPCRTPTLVLDHSPVLPLNRTALWAVSYRFSMARIMLALMLYFLIVSHKASCHTLSKAFLKSMKTW